MPEAEIGDAIGDRAHLVVGLDIGEAGAEFVVETFGRGQRLGHLELALGGDGDQLLSHVADALLQPRLPSLPGGAAQLVKLRHSACSEP